MPFEIGEQTLSAGDTIVITEVRGTHPDFRVGGVYLVRGQSKLVSAAEASLSFLVTGNRTGDGCTHGNTNSTSRIVNGSGTFELASIMRYQGWPHISLYPSSGGQSTVHVYFGKDEYLR